MNGSSDGHSAAEVDNVFIDSVATGLRGANTAAIVLGGSYSHGTPTAFSDVDFSHVVREPADREKWFEYRQGRLVSINQRTLAWWREACGRPERAIFIVRAMQEARILYDPQGEFLRFQQELRWFQWEPLQAAADLFACRLMAAQGEQVHKVLSGLVRGRGLYEAAHPLCLELTYGTAVQRGVLISSSAAYMDEVRAATGEHSAWSRLHRTVTNQDSEPVNEREQARAVLRLYVETARLLQPVLDGSDFGVRTQQICGVVTSSGPV